MIGCYKKAAKIVNYSNWLKVMGIPRGLVAIPTAGINPQIIIRNPELRI
jgi:hypothetical protein